MMEIIINPMNQQDAELIAEWEYEGIYSFYNPKKDREDLEELLSPESRENTYFSAYNDNGELIGLFEFCQDGDVVEIGLGLKPELAGRGYGQSFIDQGLQFARKTFNPRSFQLSVALFNKRAIKVYERIGFEPQEAFHHETNGGVHEFLRMVKKA